MTEPFDVKRELALSVFAAVVIDADFVRVLDSISDVDAFALLACAADDPASWDDLVLVWPR